MVATAMVVTVTAATDTGTADMPTRAGMEVTATVGTDMGMAVTATTVTATRTLITITTIMGTGMGIGTVIGGMVVGGTMALAPAGGGRPTVMSGSAGTTDYPLCPNGFPITSSNRHGLTECN